MKVIKVLDKEFEINDELFSIIPTLIEYAPKGYINLTSEGIEIIGDASEEIHESLLWVLNILTLALSEIILNSDEGVQDLWNDSLGRKISYRGISIDIFKMKKEYDKANKIILSLLYEVCAYANDLEKQMR